MIKKSFLKSVFIYVAMQSLLVSTNVYANYLAVASWNFPSGYGEYQGYAETQADALNIARQMCANAQTITSWKGFCLNNPSRVDYLSTDTPKFCGEYATPWVTNGSKRPNPCPSECTRGIELESKRENRFVDFFKAQTREHWICFKP